MAILGIYRVTSSSSPACRLRSLSKPRGGCWEDLHVFSNTSGHKKTGIEDVYLFFFVILIGIHVYVFIYDYIIFMYLSYMYII